MRFVQEEKGDIIIITAALFVILLFFTGIALDVGMVYFEHSRLENACQMVKENRFTHENTVRFSENPGVQVSSLVEDVLTDNGFTGKADVYFYEETAEDGSLLPNYRRYRMRVVLSRECPWHFLRIFGEENITIRSSIDFENSFGELSSDMVWHPGDPPESYTGKYTMDFSDGSFSFEQGKLPEDWERSTL